MGAVQNQASRRGFDRLLAIITGQAVNSMQVFRIF